MSKYKITIKGEAKTSYPHLERLDGIDSQDNFAEYFGEDEKSFSKDIKSGYMKFVFEDGKLWTITEYWSKRELTKEELDILAEYTQGQWSDGIGEGFEQNSCYESDVSYQQYTEQELVDIASGKYDDDPEEIFEVFISPWFGEQVLTIKQEIDE